MNINWSTHPGGGGFALPHPPLLVGRYRGLLGPRAQGGGGMGDPYWPMGPFGGDSEAISNGKPISSGRSFRSEGHSEWKVISNDPCELTYPMVPAGHGGEAPRAEGGRGEG